MQIPNTVNMEFVFTICLLSLTSSAGKYIIWYEVLCKCLLPEFTIGYRLQASCQYLSLAVAHHHGQPRLHYIFKARSLKQTETRGEQELLIFSVCKSLLFNM